MRQLPLRRTDTAHLMRPYRDMHVITACYQHVRRLGPTPELRTAPRLRVPAPRAGRPHLRHPPRTLARPAALRGVPPTPHPTPGGYVSAYRYGIHNASIPRYACDNGILFAGPATRHTCWPTEWSSRLLLSHILAWRPRLFSTPRPRADASSNPYVKPNKRSGLRKR